MRTSQRINNKAFNKGISAPAALLFIIISTIGFVPAKAQVDFKLNTTGGMVDLTGNIRKNCPYGSADCVISVNYNWPESSGNSNINSNAQNLSADGYVQLLSSNSVESVASSYAGQTVDVYADAIPGSVMSFRFNYRLAFSWDLHPDMFIQSAFVGWDFNGVRKYLYTDSPSGVKQEALESAITTTAGSTYISDAEGKKYYKVGQLICEGKAHIYVWDPAARWVRHSCAVDNINIHYIGKVLQKLPEGDKQTGLVTQPLANGLTVRVVDDETGLPKVSEPVSFAVLDPVNGAVLNTVAATTDLNGYSTTYLTLGTSTGTYMVRATCPGCVTGAREGTFTETGVGNELACVNCEWTGTVEKELRNPFRLRVLNKATGEPVTGANVGYTVVRFTDTNGYTSLNTHGASMRVSNAATDIYGFSRAYLTLGAEEGTYIVRARCENCLSGQEQIAQGIAHKRHIIIESEKTTEADPEDTPIVQITQVLLPNDGKSFTTAAGENYIELHARLLPASQDQNLIRWTIEDDPNDYINSGTPQIQSTNGPSSGFFPLVGQDGVPAEPTGRPLPLRYKIHAGAAVPDKPVLSQHRMVRQDEIDKCRQEYIDREIPQYGNPVPQRSGFRLGIDADFAQNVKDCYAFVYPTRAQEAVDLRKNHPGTVITGGYRSPRKNWDLYKNKTPVPIAAWTSRHMFGDAVDLGYLPGYSNAQNWGVLWEAAGPPKIFEKTGSIPIMNGAGWIHRDYQYWDLEDIYALGYCVHLGE